MRFKLLAALVLSVPNVLCAQQSMPAPTTASQTTTSAEPAIVFLPPPPPAPVKSGDVVILPATPESSSGPQSSSSGQTSTSSSASGTAQSGIVFLPAEKIPAPDPNSKPLLSGPGIYFLPDPSKPLEAKRIPVVRAQIEDKYRVKFNIKLDYRSPMTTKVVLNGPTAAFQVPAGRPSFIFYGATPYLNALTKEEDRFVDQFQRPVEVASQAYLIRLDVKNGQRWAWAGAQKLFGGTAKPSSRRRYRFSGRYLGNGLNQLSVDEDLPAGEYAFLIAHRNAETDLGDSTVGDRTYPFSAR